MSWLDPFFNGIKTILDAVGNVLPFQPAVQFTGDGVSVANDASNGRTVVTVPGGGETEVPWSSAITSDITTAPTRTAEQAVPIDTTANDVPVMVPPDPQAGDILILKWIAGSNLATISRVVSGTKIEDPTQPGQLLSSSFVLPYLGAAYRWRYSAAATAFLLENTATKIDLASGVTGILPPGAGGAGWTTVLDIDFSALPNQTIGSNGVVSIGGLNWTKGNTSNEAAAMAIVNGSGLVIQPANSTDYNNTTRTLPYIWLPLGQFLSSIEWSSGIRVAAYVSADNITGSYDNSVIGVDANNTQVSTILKRGIQASHNAGFTLQNDFAGSTSGVSQDLTLASGTRVCEIELDTVLPAVTRARYGAYSAGWPNRQTGLSHLGATSDGTRKDASIAAIEPSYKLAPANILTGMGIIVGAHCAGSGTSLSITIARLRVDVRS